MRILFTILLFLYLPFLGLPQQNLVPDPGFDITRAKKVTSLNYFPDMMSRDWRTLTERGQPRDTTTIQYSRGTSILNPYYLNYPDYYITFNNTLVRKLIPRSQPSAAMLANMYGYYKTTGLASPVHPYIMTRLKAPLQRDHYYYVEYYVKATCNYVYVSNIDLLFSVFEPGPYYCKDDINWPYAWQCEDSLRYYPANPQIKNPRNRFITDSINWTRICGVYKAEGGEAYITLGNFAHDRDTDTIPGDKRNNYPDDLYLIDDVTVTEIDFPYDTAVCSDQFPFILSPSPSFSSYFSYLQPPGTNFTIAGPGTHEYLIGNEACSAKATISIREEQPLQFSISDTTLCAENMPLIFKSPMPNFDNSWYNGSHSKSIRIDTAGKYWLTLKNSCGNKTDTFHIHLTHPPQILTPDTTVLLCKDDTLAQNATVTALAKDHTYVVWNTGETGTTIELTKPGSYTLSALNECGEDKMKVTALGCPPDLRYLLFVPNLITLNGDGKNDGWEVHYKNITIIRVEIMNRWGNVIYHSDIPSWKPDAEGIYFYIIEFLKPVTNERTIEKGWLQVTKKN